MEPSRLPLLVAGLASAPVAFYFAGSASIVVGIVIVAALASVGYLLSGSRGEKRAESISSFLLGTGISEFLIYAFRGIRYGFDDGYGLGFALVLGLIQLLGVLMVATLAILAISFCVKRYV